MEKQTNKEPRTPKFPGELQRGSAGIALTDAQEAWFRKYFPIRESGTISRLSGMSERTVFRMAKRYGVARSKKGLAAIWSRAASRRKATCTLNGYYESLKGRKPSEALLEGARRKRAAGWHPLHSCTPERLEQVREKRRAVRKEALRRDRLRIMAGLPQETRLHIPTVRYTKQQKCLRSNLRKRGYIPGDFRENMCERYVIYWDDDTRRTTIAERNAIRAGFEFRRLEE